MTNQSPEEAQAQEYAEAAAKDEQQALQEGLVQVLQQRTILLNTEVRRRDDRIAALEAEKAALEDRLNDTLNDTLQDDGAPKIGQTE